MVTFCRSGRHDAASQAGAHRVLLPPEAVLRGDKGEPLEAPGLRGEKKGKLKGKMKGEIKIGGGVEVT